MHLLIAQYSQAAPRSAERMESPHPASLRLPPWPHQILPPSSANCRHGRPTTWTAAAARVRRRAGLPPAPTLGGRDLEVTGPGFAKDGIMHLPMPTLLGSGALAVNVVGPLLTVGPIGRERSRGVRASSASVMTTSMFL